MPNTLYWRSQTGEWNAASWGGTLPTGLDTLFADGRSQVPFLTSLDRSIAGSVDYVVNGTFATDTVWTKGTGWTIAAGVAAAAAGSASDLSQAGILVIGRAYRVTGTVSGYVAGTLTVKLGTTALSPTISANGAFTVYGICAGDTTLRFSKGATYEATGLDNVSVVDDGLFVTKFESRQEYTGNIGGGPSVPLIIGFDDFIHRGSGKLYLQLSGGGAAQGCKRITIDTPNIAHEIIIGTTVSLQDLRVVRGRMKYQNLLHSLRCYLGYRTNPALDSYLTLDEGVWFDSILQDGGNMVYKGIQSGADKEIYEMGGGYCQFDGYATSFSQLGGHVDLGVEITPAAFSMTNAYLRHGSMDTTKGNGVKVIENLWIDEDHFELIEDGRLEVTNRYPLDKEP